MTSKVGKRFSLAWGVVLTGGALLYPEGKTPVVVVALSMPRSRTAGCSGGSSSEYYSGAPISGT